MRIFVAGLSTETNTFAPLATGRAAFEKSLQRPSGVVGLAERLLAENGDEAIASITAGAEPSGTTVGAVFEELRDRILEDLRAALPVDGVLLSLHGAMVAQGYDDCEGDILARVRALVGPDAPIIAVLDPHAHLTERMLAEASVLIFLKEYPHTDGEERLRDAVRIMHAATRGEIKPVMAAFDMKMIGIFPTTAEPLAGFVREMEALETRAGVLSVSLVHGFPWADVADVGAKMLIVTDGDATLAQELAEEMGRRLYAKRDQLRFEGLSIAEALAFARAKSELVVFADVSDNPGGGAAGDNTAVLKALLAEPIGPAALGLLWDPCAVDACFEAGEGAEIPLRIGGKTGPSSGSPIDVTVRVAQLNEKLVQKFFGGKQSVGRSARVSIGALDVILTSTRVQTFAPQVFAEMGVAVEGLRLIVVKSMHHYHALFSPLTPHLLRVDAGGALPLDFGGLPYTKRSGAYWPQREDPLGA